MADKITRRSFLRGTGKTILTAGALSSGIGLSTSTTPTTVIPKVMTWKNLNVLTPKAKAYRSYLRGIRALGEVRTITGKWTKRKERKTNIKSIITKQRIGTGKTQAIAGQSPARQAFDDSTRKAKRPGVWPTRQERQSSSKNVASQIAPNPQAKIPPSQRTKSIWARQTDTIAKNLTESARKELARELREQRRLNKRMKTKSKGARVGGGGKMALPGLESAKNPTGMSLITQRYTL